MIKRLLRENAKINTTAKRDNRIALQAVAEDSYLDVIKRLLREKTEINAAGDRTTLQIVAKDSHLDVMERLRTAGAK